MKNDEFDKLFKYMEDFRRDVNERFDQTATKEQLKVLQDAVDGLTGSYDTLVKENAADAHATRRLDDRIDQLDERVTTLELSQRPQPV
ncbi:hypothetical protein FWF48_03395 [Candidatus Saccharibacteria bacterium]|nr:hypothetical protein [Candidatus Saccharibacteria bacterium]